MKSAIELFKTDVTGVTTKGVLHVVSTGAASCRPFIPLERSMVYERSWLPHHLGYYWRQC